MSEHIAAAIGVLRAAYPRQDFPDASVEFYAHKLADLDGAELVAAIDRLTNRLNWLPSVAEIRLEVAEARLGLPNASEAWDIAVKGGLRFAPAPVREAAEAVGGRWTILHSDNPDTVRAQFRRDYEERRQHAVLIEAGAILPSPVFGALPRLLNPKLNAALFELEESERIRPRPVMAREARRLAGRHLDSPTDEERSDAIAILRGCPLGDVSEDALYAAAELVMVHADRDDREAAS